MNLMGWILFITSAIVLLRWIGTDRCNAVNREAEAVAAGFAHRNGRDYQLSTLAMGVVAAINLVVAINLFRKIGWYEALPLEEREQYYSGALLGLAALGCTVAAVKLAVTDDVSELDILGIIVFGLLTFPLAISWWWYEAFFVFQIFFLMVWAFIGVIIWRTWARVSRFFRGH